MTKIKKKVGQLVKKYGTSDPFKLAAALNITIVYEPLGSFSGYYSRSHRFKVIHINEDLTHAKQIVACAHELGHAIFHPDSNSAFLRKKTRFPTSKIEQEANEFMIELLFIQSLNNNTITIKEATADYGIPEQFLKKKFYS